ncbi:unnamed protein product [Schistosoma bovis]|nr:unnamed protein product [Schistosoma bovis]
MGNTPTHYKRRFSGDVCSRLPNSTPPGVSVTIPPPKKRNTHSLTDLSRSAPADYPNNEMSVNDDNVSPNDKDAISIDEATSMMRATSLREPINIIDAHDNLDDNNRLYNVLPSDKMVTSTISSGDEKISNFLQERPSSAGPLYSTDEQIMYKHSQPQIILNNVSRDRARTLPSRKLVGLKLPTVFRWNGGGKDIYISGTFNNWEKRIPMVKRNSGVYVIIDCKPGIHQYKYFIDGAWYHDPTKPTVENEYGTKNNVVQVRSSDFDVLHALEHDQASSRRRSNSSESSEHIKC